MFVLVDTNVYMETIIYVWIWLYIVECSSNADVCMDTGVYVEINVYTETNVCMDIATSIKIFT